MHHRRHAIEISDKSTFVCALRKRARVLRPAGKSGRGTFREQTFLIKWILSYVVVPINLIHAADEGRGGGRVRGRQEI